MMFLRRYPSSFLRLILLGYGVVLLPLLPVDLVTDMRGDRYGTGFLARAVHQ